MNESPILYEAKCFMITKIRFLEIERRVYVFNLLRGTYFTPRSEDFEQNATVMLGRKEYSERAKSLHAFPLY